MRPLVVLLLVAVVALAGCGGSGGGSGGGEAVGANLRRAADYVERILRGESPQAVIAAADDASRTLGRLVRERATAAKGVYDDLNDPGTRTAACLTLEWADENGGASTISTADLVEFAAGQFGTRERAEGFVEHAQRLTDLDLAAAALVACDVDGAGG